MRALSAWPLAVALAVACAPRVRVTLPGGAGRPDPGAVERYAEATARCAGVRTWSGEIALAGRVRGDAVRGRVLAGSTSTGDVRLEGVAPFGGPVFVLAARNERATLLLPREDRALMDAPASAVLEALAGLPLAAADLHAVLTGCVVAERTPSNGRALDDGWLAVDLGVDRTAFLRGGTSGWQVSAARVGPLAIAYEAREAGSPREIRISSLSGPGGELQLRLRLAQVEENGELPAEAFQVSVPADARPLTLQELRARGLSFRES
jgi:hypothetical protein